MPEDEPTGAQEPKALREALDRANAEAQAGRDAQRELAFLKAGVDTAAPMAAYAMKTYDGELTVEAVATFADGLQLPKAGAAPAAPAEPTGPPPTGEAAVRNNLAGAAVPAPPVDTDALPSMEEVWSEYRGLLASGQSREDASAAIIGRVFAGARAGEEQFIFDANAHKAAARELA